MERAKNKPANMRWTREDLREGTTVADIASNDDVLSAYAEFWSTIRRIASFRLTSRAFLYSIAATARLSA